MHAPETEPDSRSGDERAAEIPGPVPGHVARQQLDSLDECDLLALGRYGAR